MRHLLAIALASLAAAACSSAPTGGDSETETSASTAQAVEFCPVGTKPVCTGSICKCVATPPPPVCEFDEPTPTVNTTPQYSWYVEAWATEQTGGQCPDLAAATGTWKNVDPNYPIVQDCFTGVPCVNGAFNIPPSCSAVYGTQPCCTYVWWPAGFTLQPITLTSGYSCYAPIESACSTNPSSANTSVLCRESGESFTALENDSCSAIPGWSCGSPGGSSCTGCPKI